MINIISWVKSKFKKTKGEDINLACPSCGSVWWIPGASGGASQNVTCGKCGDKYNHIGPGALQLIEKRIDSNKSKHLEDFYDNQTNC